MLTDLCQELRNWFVNAPQDKHFGKFEIKDGKITPSDFIKEGQYFRIVGSALNDGVYNNKNAVLNPLYNAPQNETFEGAIWLMSVPYSVLKLVNDIEQFNADVEELKLIDKGYASESFGGYSYTLSSSAPVHLQEREKMILRAKSRWKKV